MTAWAIDYVTRAQARIADCTLSGWLVASTPKQCFFCQGRVHNFKGFATHQVESAQTLSLALNYHSASHEIGLYSEGLPPSTCSLPTYADEPSHVSNVYDMRRVKCQRSTFRLLVQNIWNAPRCVAKHRATFASCQTASPLFSLPVCSCRL